MLVFPLTPCEKISVLHYTCRLFTVLCPATVKYKFSQPAARLCTAVLLLFFCLIILDSSFGLPTLLGRDSFLFLLGERREETSAHKPCSQPLLTTSRLAFPIVYAEIISACHICRALACKAFPPKQSFSSFRLNYAELADFRLYQTLFVRETIQKFLLCLWITELLLNRRLN